jgi:CRISPR-associated protein Cas1
VSQQKYNRLQSNRNDSSIANRYLRADSRPECIMSWRIVVISKRAKLDYQLGYLVVRNEEVTKIHLSEISTILIESTAATVTTSLLAELTKKKIKVIFCDEKRNPSSELVGYYGSHDTSNKIRKQIQWSRHSKEAIWTEIVTEKIRKQKELLKNMGKEEAGLLESYLQEIGWNDETNREGHAAKVYFNALFGMTFTRTADCPENAALNYGYSILLSAFAREIVASGYITQLGLFHDNMFNQFNLASDLMEPFRVLIDREVIQMQRKEFTHEEKIQLVNVLNNEVMIDGKTQYVNNAIKIYCKSVFDALNENDSALIRFYGL